MLPLPSLFIESSDIITATSQSREVQRKDDGAGIRRARFHLSIMDTNSLMPGQDFEELGDNYVIFITENDVLKKGLPLYTIDRSIRETGERIDDGSHILYVNGAVRDTKTPLGKLMHDFFCVDPDKMWYPVLAKRTRYFKEDERGINEMGSLYERLLSEGEARGLKMGEARGRAGRSLKLFAMISSTRPLTGANKYDNSSELSHPIDSDLSPRAKPPPWRPWGVWFCSF